MRVQEWNIVPRDRPSLWYRWLVRRISADTSAALGTTGSIDPALTPGYSSPKARLLYLKATRLNAKLRMAPLDSLPDGLDDILDRLMIHEWEKAELEQHFSFDVTADLMTDIRENERIECEDLRQKYDDDLIVWGAVSGRQRSYVTFGLVKIETDARA